MLCGFVQKCSLSRDSAIAFEINEQRTKAAAFDHRTSVCFAGVNYHITAEGQSHLTCYIPFVKKKREGTKNP